MKYGRIAYQGAIHPVTEAGTGVRLADGRQLEEGEFIWLPPLKVGTVFALGLNYADHAKELAFKAPEVPLVFLKGPNTIIGHRAQTRRPADATYMHYECELAVVIGKTGYQVAKADAMEIVAGYTVANDYAIRDYLENYYRPNLRVKNRDGCTPLGPWLVDRDRSDVTAPHDPHQRPDDAAGDDRRHDFRHRHPDCLPQFVHDAEPGRRHPHRHAGGTRRRQGGGHR